MPRNPTVRSIELEGDYFHARVRDPERFDEIRTPEWASNVADDVEAGAEVRMGHSGDDWVVQSILVPENVERAEARRAAEQMLEKFETAASTKLRDT